MFYLIYVSSARSLMTDRELRELLEQARLKNGRLEVTGMLLYKDGNFIQMLEGEEKVVRGLYDRITADPRHTLVTELLTGECRKRSFENWSMGFQNLNKEGSAARYREFVEQNLDLRSFEADAQDAYSFLVQFNEMNC